MGDLLIKIVVFVFVVIIGASFLVDNSVPATGGYTVGVITSLIAFWIWKILDFIFSGRITPFK